MTQRFRDRTVLVTGGGSGIGRATAIAFARDGANVVVAGRSREPLEHTVDLIEVDDGSAAAVVADVTVEREVMALVDAAVARFGRLDVAFNNAGVLLPGDVDRMTLDDWSHVMAVNLTGIWLAMKHEIASMRRHRRGAIVNMASTVGRHAVVPGLGAYGASKAAVSALTRAAAIETIADGIRINALSCGPVNTPMSRLPGETDGDRDRRFAQVLPIGRVASVEEVAAAVLWLASDDAGYVAGHDLVVDGGGVR